MGVMGVMGAVNVDVSTGALLVVAVVVQHTAVIGGEAKDG